MGASGYVHVNVEKVVAETDKAFLLRIDGEDVWIPKGQMSDPDDYEKGDEDVSVAITEWIFEQKGL